MSALLKIVAQLSAYQMATFVAGHFGDLRPETRLTAQALAEHVLEEDYGRLSSADAFYARLATAQRSESVKEAIMV